MDDYLEVAKKFWHMKDESSTKELLGIQTAALISIAESLQKLAHDDSVPLAAQSLNILSSVVCTNYRTGYDEDEVNFIRVSHPYKKAS